MIPKKNKQLESTISQHQLEIDSMQAQINEQQKSDSMEKMRKQYEYTMQSMRDSHERELAMLRERVANLQAELDEKNANIELLNDRVIAITRNWEKLSLEHADLSASLTKKLTEQQSKYNFDIQQLQE